MTVPELPDTKAVLIAYVNAHPDLPAELTVGGSVPDNLDAHLPYAAVFRAPGPAPMMWARWDRAALNVQVWAADEADALGYARTLFAICHRAEGQTVAAGVIGQVTDVTGLGSVPDPGYPDLGRAVFTVGVQARNP